MARTLSRSIGRDVTYVNVTPADYKRSLMSAGTDEWLADALVELLVHVTPRLGSLVTSVVADVAGKAPIAFAQFARDHADAFRGKRPDPRELP